MSGENIITPPRKGDPVTADWAGELTRAVNAAQTAQTNGGSLSTPFGFSPEPTVLPQGGDLPENPMPFDVIGIPTVTQTEVVNEAVYMAIPNYARGIVPVTFGGVAINRWTQQPHGDANTAWTLIDTIAATGTGTARAARLGFIDETPQGGERSPAWRVFVANETDSSAPSWAMDGYPIVTLARWNFPSIQKQSFAPSCHDGVTQFVRGAVHLFSGAFWTRGGDSTTNYGASFKLGSDNGGWVTVSTTAPT